MEIKVIFACCGDYLGETQNGIHTVPDDCTIAEALSAFEIHYERRFPDELDKHLGFMVNGKSAQTSTRLGSGDNLIVLRKIYGG